MPNIQPAPRPGPDNPPRPIFPKCPNLTIEPWFDPLTDPNGHDPRSDYSERFWLSLMGPSTMCLLRHLANELDRNPRGFTLPMRHTARALGMGVGTGAKAPFIRSIERCCRFGVARFIGPSALAVRRMIPPLNPAQTARLPYALKREHKRWSEGAKCRPDPGEIQGRARQLALTLFQLGEDLAATEHQLQRWHFHPAIVHEAARWALAHHEESIRRSNADS